MSQMVVSVSDVLFLLFWLYIVDFFTVPSGFGHFFDERFLLPDFIAEPASDQMCPTLQPATGDHGASHFR